MNNSVSNVNFKATMKLEGVGRTQKLKKIIKSIEKSTIKSPDDTIVLRKNGFNINCGSVNIPAPYMEELLALPVEKITAIILKLLNMHKRVAKANRTMPIKLYDNLYKQINAENSSKSVNEFYQALDSTNRIQYKNEAAKDPILKHIDFESVRF